MKTPCNSHGEDESLPIPLGLEWDAPDVSLSQVDDFELGTACGLDHEECEACQ